MGIAKINPESSSDLHHCKSILYFHFSEQNSEIKKYKK